MINRTSQSLSSQPESFLDRLNGLEKTLLAIKEQRGKWVDPRKLTPEVPILFPVESFLRLLDEIGEMSSIDFKGCWLKFRPLLLMEIKNSFLNFEGLAWELSSPNSITLTVVQWLTKQYALNKLGELDKKDIELIYHVCRCTREHVNDFSIINGKGVSEFKKNTDDLIHNIETLCRNAQIPDKLKNTLQQLKENYEYTALLLMGNGENNSVIQALSIFDKKYAEPKQSTETKLSRFWEMLSRNFDPSLIAFDKRAHSSVLTFNEDDIFARFLSEEIDESFQTSFQIAMEDPILFQVFNREAKKALDTEKQNLMQNYSPKNKLNFCSFSRPKASLYILYKILQHTNVHLHLDQNTQRSAQEFTQEIIQRVFIPHRCLGNGSQISWLLPTSQDKENLISAITDSIPRIDKEYMNKGLDEIYDLFIKANLFRDENINSDVRRRCLIQILEHVRYPNVIEGIAKYAEAVDPTDNLLKTTVDTKFLREFSDISRYPIILEPNAKIWQLLSDRTKKKVINEIKDYCSKSLLQNEHDAYQALHDISHNCKIYNLTKEHAALILFPHKAKAEDIVSLLNKLYNTSGSIEDKEEFFNYLLSYWLLQCLETREETLLQKYSTIVRDFLRAIYPDSNLCDSATDYSQIAPKCLSYFGEPDGHLILAVLLHYSDSPIKQNNVDRFHMALFWGALFDIQGIEAIHYLWMRFGDCNEDMKTNYFLQGLYEMLIELALTMKTPSASEDNEKIEILPKRLLPLKDRIFTISLEYSDKKSFTMMAAIDSILSRPLIEKINDLTLWKKTFEVFVTVTRQQILEKADIETNADCSAALRHLASYFKEDSTYSALQKKLTEFDKFNRLAKDIFDLPNQYTKKSNSRLLIINRLCQSARDCYREYVAGNKTAEACELTLINALLEAKKFVHTENVGLGISSYFLGNRNSVLETMISNLLPNNMIFSESVGEDNETVKRDDHKI